MWTKKENALHTNCSQHGGGGDVCVVCGVVYVRAGVCVTASTETLLLDLSTSALPIKWKILFGSHFTDCETMAYQSCCCFLAQFLFSVRTQTVKTRPTNRKSLLTSQL